MLTVAGFCISLYNNDCYALHIYSISLQELHINLVSVLPLNWLYRSPTPPCVLSRLSKLAQLENGLVSFPINRHYMNNELC